MNSPKICGACGMAIETCPECGGFICSTGCPDRADDGCICEYITDTTDESDDEIV